MIYFIRGKESGNIKIGFSIHPDKRKANLQTAHYEELEFIGIMDGSLEDEANIKKKFSQFNIRGEWFYPSQEIIDFAKENCKPKKNIVSYLGNGEYRITFLSSLKFTINFFLLAGTHKIRILSDDECNLVFGVEGERETLLDWLGSLDGVTQNAIEEFAQTMKD